MKNKWNWVDTLLIGIIVLGVLVFLNRNKILDKSKEVVSSGGKSIVITIEAEELTRDMITDLKVGDQMFSQNNLQKGFVRDIQVEPKLHSYIKENGQLGTYEDKSDIKVTVTVDAEVASSGPYMDLGGQEIKVGLPIIMKTTSVEFPGIVKYIEVK